MARNVQTLIVAGLALLFLLLGGSGIVAVKYNLQSAFQNEKIYEITALREENVALRAALDVYKEEGKFSSGISEPTIFAHVFSPYPYNIKNRLAIDVGRADGVKSQNTVIQNGILIGQIIEVYDTSSIVQTVFDPGWEFSVRIGEQSIDALFQGGSAPRLTFIPKEAIIAPGDSIVSSFAGIPYGIAIGTVGEIRITDEPFLEAQIVVPYNINRLHTVGVILTGSR